jgi:hypothetical protein
MKHSVRSALAALALTLALLTMSPKDGFEALQDGTIDA